ncbi:hypothetical protein SAMN05444581_1436 [Methylocapsa palsarum]|uniref:Uncharacterized protein n=1 Tax=Methylocapsa palsarum TaxID=1612308 RepID=A0A1I4D9A7_9HYPH|nr:hypothetical protein SAMN05444581_1436 [Methylocapsa palsarum]
MSNLLKIIASGLVLTAGGLGLFGVSASATPSIGLPAISEVSHLTDASGVSIDHAQFPCTFPLPCGYGYYQPTYYSGRYYVGRHYGGGYYRGMHRGPSYYGRGHAYGHYGRGYRGGGHGGWHR